jgi:hypothetical protein
MPVDRAVCAALLALVSARPEMATAAEPPPVSAETAAPEPDEDPAFKRLRKRLEAEPSPYARVFLTGATGFGLRFNNPYRLATQLGDEASSVSIPGPYVDFAATVALGPPNGPQHGASLHVGSTVAGVLQPFITPSYVLAYRAELPILVYGRFGTPILLAPDANIGGELAGSLSYFFNSGLGLTSEIAFDLFYGAATLERQYSVIPILNFQLGVIVDYEFLP